MKKLDFFTDEDSIAFITNNRRKINEIIDYVNILKEEIEELKNQTLEEI